MLALLEPSGSDLPGELFWGISEPRCCRFWDWDVGAARDARGDEGFLGWRRIFGVVKDIWGDERCSEIPAGRFGMSPGAQFGALLIWVGKVRSWHY